MPKIKSPYLTVADVAKKWKVSAQQVKKYLAAGRIPGAIQPGREWLIPRDAKKPEPNPPGRAPKA